MGMSIDKAIDIMEHYKEYGLFSQTNGRNKAIDIMRKYQKIKEQVDIAIDKENFAISGARLIQIRDIINGNDD